MSRNVKNTKNIKNSTPIQKYCKVCHDAGKTEAEYRSHFIRESADSNSKIVCPTLLALECRYCYKNGHTVKYCQTLKDNEKKQKRNEATNRRIESAKAEKPKGKTTLSSTNAFDCLDCDSEDEVIFESQIKEEFPQLSAPISRNESVSFNYAAALAKPIAQKQFISPVAITPISVSKPAIQSTKTDTKVAAPWASRPANTVPKSWAAWDSDSDDSDNEELPDVNFTDDKPIEEDDETW